MIAKLKSKNYKISLVIMTILMFLYYRSFYWTSPEIGMRKIVEVLIILIGVIVVPVIVVEVPLFNNIVDRISGVCIRFVRYINNNAVKAALVIGLYLVVPALSYIFELCIDSLIYHTEFNIMRFYIITAFNTIVYVCYLVRGIIHTRPELVFFIVVMIIGVTYVKVTPPIVGLSWDDQIHYERTLYLANALNGISYAADDKMIYECETNSVQRIGYDRQSREDYVNQLTGLYDNKKVNQLRVPQFSASFVAYIPAAIGITLARGMGLSYTHIFVAGKICNLIMYAALMYFAIKKIRFGKVFTSVFGMLPVVIFLASSYSYDSWLIAFSVLGFSYLISSMYDNDKKICNTDMIRGIIFIAVGCLVKQVYFPFILIAVFIAMINFGSSKKDVFRILLVTVVASIFVLATFVIPMIYSPASASDIRGGGGVDAIGQIKYVINNPLVYAKTLFSFLKSYLAIENMSYLTGFAYVGNGEYWGITGVVLIVVAFLDRSSEMKANKVLRIAGLVMAFGTIVLVASALYASFTPVGADTIAGCSPRYIVPVLFPALYLLVPDSINVSFSRRRLFLVPVIILSLVIFHSMDVLCASIYI